MPIEICDKKKCTGCGSCVNVCPKHCINLEMNEEGFYYPKIDDLHCVRCGICQKLCIENKTIDKNKKPASVYALWSLDNNARNRSSSGGVAWELSQFFILNSGVVYGCVFDENQHVIHARIDDLENLKRTQGSKYVQSDISSVFNSLKDDVSSGKLVLFTGTPCQISAVYNLLSKFDLTNFYTIDLVCHGASSPGLFQEYLNDKTKQYGDKIKNIEFRNKDKNKRYIYIVKISFSKRKPIYISSLEDEYMSCFLRCATYRDCCYECRYCTPERVGDFTLGDFFGISPSFITNKDYRAGLSSMLINTKKGKELFLHISNRFHFIKRPIEEIIATNHNLIKPSKKPLYREEILLDNTITLKTRKNKYCKSTLLTYCFSFISHLGLFRRYVLHKHKF